MLPYKLTFRVHSIQRMFQRGIYTEEVRHVLETGEVIEEYPLDAPFPSRLVLGWSGKRALHVVAADNHRDRKTIVITVYEPDAVEWESGFKRRKT